MGEHFAGELERLSAMLGERPVATRRRGQRLDDPLAHFRCSLARKRDRDNLLRSFDERHQTQKALYQKFRLSGACGRLDDKRSRGIERFRPFRLVG